jgi:hypothetical protein
MLKPEKGLGSVRSGIGTPAFNTRTELLLIDAGLLPEATIMLKLANMMKKKINEAIMIPVIVAKV